MSHATNNSNLVKMANQIESFFRSEPDHDAAIAGIENHIKRFWDPRMRKAIIAHVESGGDGLGELAKAAIRKCAQGSVAAT
jgi:formate dehydrogenase subunit delta